MRRFLLAILIMTPLLTAAQEDSPQPIQLQVWHAFGGEVVPFLDRMIEDFNQTHPGIVAEAIPQGSYEDTFSALETRLAESGEGEQPPPVPHLVHISNLDTQQAFDSGWFIPVTGTGYYESLLQDHTFDDTLYGIPWNTAIPVLYANQSYLQSLPTSLEEFTTTCENISITCATWPIDAWLVENWAGGVALDTAAFSEFAAWWQDMNLTGNYFSNRRLADWEDAINRFLDGDAALLVGSTEDALRLSREAGFPIQTGGLPGAAGGFAPQGGALWMTGDHPPQELEAAQTLLTWLTNTENTVRWHKGTGYIPTRPLASEVLNEQNWFAAHPAFGTAVQAVVEDPNVSSKNGAERSIKQIVEEGMLRIIGGIAVENEVPNMQARIERALAAYRGE